MAKFVHKLHTVMTFGIKPASVGLGVVVAVTLMAMMLLTAADVILRYFFKLPITGSYDVTSFLMVIAVGLSLGLCQLDRGHISVDIVTQYLPKRVVRALNVFHALISLVFLALLMWQTFVHFWTLYEAHTMAVTIAIPHWPFAFILGLGLVFYWLVYVRDMADDLGATVGDEG